jgi:small subunit ribosomal protein S18
VLTTTNNKRNFKDSKNSKNPKNAKNIIKVKKSCGFCRKEMFIDYKNLELLTRFLTPRAKIISRRVSGLCAKHQRIISQEIKLARFLSLLPFSN